MTAASSSATPSVRAAHYSGMAGSATTLARKPVGTPAGGQFAARSGAAPEIDLSLLADLDAAVVDHQRAVAFAAAANRSRILIVADPRLPNGVRRCVDCGRFDSGSSAHECPYPKLARALGDDDYSRRLAHAGFDAASELLWRGAINRVGVTQAGCARELGVGPMHAIALRRRGIDFEQLLGELTDLADDLDEQLGDEDRAELRNARRNARAAHAQLTAMMSDLGRMVRRQAARLAGATGLPAEELAAAAMERLHYRLARTDLPALDQQRLPGYIKSVLRAVAIDMGTSRSQLGRRQLSERGGDSASVRTVPLDLAPDLPAAPIVAAATTGAEEDAADDLIAAVDARRRSKSWQLQSCSALDAMFELPPRMSLDEDPVAEVRRLVRQSGGVAGLIDLIDAGEATDEQLDAIFVPWGGYDAVSEPDCRKILGLLRKQPDVLDLMIGASTAQRQPRRKRAA